MRWLHYSDLTPQPDLPQAVNLLADVKALAKQIPFIPRQIPTSEGPPSPMFEWYGRIGQRLVVIETAADLDAADAVVVRTPYISADRGGDWKILHELSELPDCIRLTRPLGIESRTRCSNQVIYRPHECGWNDAIYVAASRAEAEGLLNYLAGDNFNANCFIRESETEGEWGIIRKVDGHEEVIGAYPRLNATLRVACQMSLRRGQSMPLLVRGLHHGAAGHWYEVVNGRVVAAH